MVPYQDTVQLTPYEEGLQRLERRIEALEADSGAWFGEEQAKADTNAALHRLTEQLEVDVHRLDHRIDLLTHGPGPSLQMALQRAAAAAAAADDLRVQISDITDRITVIIQGMILYDDVLATMRALLQRED